MILRPDWTPDQPMVRLSEVRKSFGDLDVLKGVSMAVMKGEVVCIIGPSGSGKSTLIRCINALTEIDSGSITVEAAATITEFWKPENTGEPDEKTSLKWSSVGVKLNTLAGTA